MIAVHHLPERRGCLVGLSRDSYRHPPEADQTTLELSAKIVEIAHARRRFQALERAHAVLERRAAARGQQLDVRTIQIAHFATVIIAIGNVAENGLAEDPKAIGRRNPGRRRCARASSDRERKPRRRARRVADLKARPSPDRNAAYGPQTRVADISFRSTKVVGSAILTGSSNSSRYQGPCVGRRLRKAHPRFLQHQRSGHATKHILV